MTSYFEEHDFGENEGENETIDLLLLARMFLRGEGLIEMDIGSYSDHLKAPPASKKVVEELPRKTSKNTPTGKASCPVCLETYENTEIYIELPCKHKFHEYCILSWLKQTNSCPVCRHELPTDNPEYEQLRCEKEREKQRPFRVEALHSSMFC
ncbi:E3 ubiquitin- ligase RNF181 [Paramuricea clavata]|uniref:E3 ubiquitin-protein ligase RNF181 n=1 Tax=Paramuricea clavata TaxID=317549 RepID=A0A7D9H855_PARCT|nr:E3 ubiquitin- ligase RNF181 [Paramuricea clavata]